MPQERDRARERWSAAKRSLERSEAGDLLDFVDVSELLDAIDRHAGSLASAIGVTKPELSGCFRGLRNLVPLRNRVCHARPLEPDDYAVCMGTIELFAACIPKGLGLPELGEVRQLVARDPHYPLLLAIPEFWRQGLNQIPNNLPVPEYDDTGFIGRRIDRDALLRNLRGVHPVISVTGEGGVGKTSLALQCLFDVASDSNRPFDHIVWVTLKTSVLTVAGVREIAGALTSPTGALEAAVSVVGPPPHGATFDELIAYTLEFMRGFRILLAIDNMETIDRDALRPLFAELPSGSKVLITSRYGIGEFEYRYRLNEMDRTDAIRLLRSTARLLNVDLWKREDAFLGTLCEALFFNPQAIRWFVQSNSEGRPIADLLERRRSLIEVLDFCFHTLYTGLAEAQRHYLRILVAVGKPLSEVQLALLSGTSSLEEIRASLAYLHSSNLVSQVADDWGRGPANLWTVSEFARAYVTTRDKDLLALRPRVVPTYRALLKARDQARDAVSINPFRVSAIEAHTTDEATVVSLLKTAVRESTSGRNKVAVEHIARAKALLPYYYEVWRVSAQITDAAGDAMGANADYDRALELADGRSQPLLVHYANFLVAHDDPDTAMDVLRSIPSLDDADPRLIGSYAWASALAGDLAHSLELFGRLKGRLRTLGGQERQAIASQYCKTAVMAADRELKRRLPASAMALLLEGLDTALECRDTLVDRPLIEATQQGVDAACRVIAHSGSIEDWESLALRLESLRAWIPVQGLRHPGIDLLARSCLAIAGLDSFLLSFGPNADRPAILFGEALIPSPGNDYSFVRGDDGSDYFLHHNELEIGTWETLGKPGHSRVRFTASPSRDGNRQQARMAEVIEFDDL